ncbi:hypothetical protein LCI18_015254 [Fusarium solani-melongenae]|uniref:Uncharacterized protein n=1 Tax=Fusarium solani subsp. cucurbitae TaxID=2747967 RepID=A0ACD3ZSH6_FUSSC|nr:hypothetical protein LCI18_015254 [Fusarium solani-melongenae]
MESEVSGEAASSHGPFFAEACKSPSMPYHSSYVTYYHFPFLTLGNLSQLPTHEVQFLEISGSLHLPCQPILLEFVRQYFLHVHPSLPILNEGDFWDMYLQTSNARIPGQRISLLLFQAMLYSCCNLISHKKLNALGLSNMRQARGSSSIDVSRAALLLSSWGVVPGRPMHKSSHVPWLSIAIQYAKDAEADRYDAYGDDMEKQATLKRLWWCCIIQDHLFSLNLRRVPHITSRHFDFEQSATLTFSDLSNETYRSKVHEPETKAQLARILELLVELCVLLTEALECVFPVDGKVCRGGARIEGKTQIHSWKAALKRWHKEAKTRLPQLNQAYADRHNAQNDSVVLFAALLTISSTIVLSHYELLRLATMSAESTFDNILLNDNRLQVQNASLGTTGCLEKLLRLRLARCLPVSAIACSTTKHLTLKRHCLRILNKAMDIHKLHYEGVDWVGDTIQHIVSLMRIEYANIVTQLRLKNPQPGTVVNDCLKLIIMRPSWYLRVALAFDVSLSTGRLPKYDVLRRFSQDSVAKGAAHDEDSNATMEAGRSANCSNKVAETKAYSDNKATVGSFSV